MNKNFFKLGINGAFFLRKHGIRISREEEASAGGHRQKQEFIDRARGIYNRHLAQTKADVRALERKYDAPVLGHVYVWDLFPMLGRCIDPSDPALYCVTQLVHTLQVVSGMEHDGITDRDLLLTALIHDLGKILLLTDEAPENIVCGNTPIGTYDAGVGFDRCVFQWNHDSFAYSRFKDHVPDHVAWLVRYHSVYLQQCEGLMDERDRDYAHRYLGVFQHYDKGTKSLYLAPTTRLEKYRDLIERAFPDPIAF